MDIISLDSSLQSSLNWQKAIEEAFKLKKAQKKILWLLDFDLRNLKIGFLDKQSHFLAFSLAIKHFKENIWPEFANYSLGVAFYKGEHFFQDFFLSSTELISFQVWCQEKFKTIAFFNQEAKVNLSTFKDITENTAPSLTKFFKEDLWVNYLENLQEFLDLKINKFIILKQKPKEELIFIHSLNGQKFSPFKIFLEKEKTIWSINKKCSVAFCLPSRFVIYPSHYTYFEKVLKILTLKAIEFKWLPEEELIQNLEGLNYLLYFPEFISTRGKRNLQGFMAAGGETLILSKSLEENLLLKQLDNLL